MFKLLCVCVLLVKYANSTYFQNELGNINRNRDEDKRRTLAFLKHSAWQPYYFRYSSEPNLKYGPPYHKPITIIKPPTIERTYRTEITVQESRYPYLFQIMEMIPIKGQISFQYIYQKLFSYYIALQKFNPKLQPLNTKNLIQILQFVFPELGDKIYEIAKYPIGPPMLKVLCKLIFPELSNQDLESIFRGAHTTKEFIINLVLYLCPDIRGHYLWKADLPVNGKLASILHILFPEDACVHQINDSIQDGVENSMYTFLDLLFQGKLVPNTQTQSPTPEEPDWTNFLNVLSQYNINYKTIPKDVLLHLFSNYKTPEFKIYLLQLKEKLDKETKETYKMDTYTLTVLIQYLHDLKTHKKTLNDIPPEIKLLLKRYKNPQELIQTISNSIGIPIDTSKVNNLDPKTQDLWNKFIFDILNQKEGTHLPKELLDYLNTLSQNPDYKSYLNAIFDTVSINPSITAKWNTFFDQLRNGHTTLDQMPTDLLTFLTNQQNPEVFLRFLLKLKDPRINTNFLNADINPKMMILWKKYIEDVATSKGNLRNIPQELLQYFYKLSANPSNVEYIKHLFNSDKINPKTLQFWNQFIKDLKSHKVGLEDMPSEIIQWMLKYKNPEDFFKVLLPQSNIEVNKDVTPNDKVKNQWMKWILDLQNRNTSVFDTPQELKEFFKNISHSKDFQTSLQEINSINPDLLMKWKQFMNDLKQHKKSLFTMPKDLKKYILAMRTPQEFINLIFKTLDPPLTNPVPTPSVSLAPDWEVFLSGLAENYTLKGEPVDSVVFTNDFSNYLKNASNNANYKQAVNNLYQMDPSVKTMFEELKHKMLQDYNVTLDHMPQKLLFFTFKFENPTDFLRSILAAYLEDFKLEEFPDDNIYADLYMAWLRSISDISRHKTEIIPRVKFILKYMTRATPFKSQIEDVIKLHESNALVTRVENLWRETKQKIKVHDGLEVFLQSMEKLGDYYKGSEELCEERHRIIKAIDRMKMKFAQKSECTGAKFLA